ncbi:hypothetical protein J2805_004700 [Arthrobacter oryzae]|nr:hypothetical protein [Arthrobacter oryzae]
MNWSPEVGLVIMRELQLRGRVIGSSQNAPSTWNGAFSVWKLADDAPIAVRLKMAFGLMKQSAYGFHA